MVLRRNHRSSGVIFICPSFHCPCSSPFFLISHHGPPGGGSRLSAAGTYPVLCCLRPLHILFPQPGTVFSRPQDKWLLMATPAGVSLDNLCSGKFSPNSSSRWDVPYLPQFLFISYITFSGNQKKKRIFRETEMGRPRGSVS